LAELLISDDAPGALERLRSAGYVLVVVTNQPDVGRGRLTRHVADAINRRLQEVLEVDAIYVCFHSGVAPCSCRKPAPGMLIAASEALALDLSESWMVGDRWVDIAAGRAAGVTTVLLERPGSWGASSGRLPPSDLRPDHVVATLAAAATLVTESVR
jgi:D-glycero-D-manno-heptose 1,7-bisphosphate phosphatase